jgi:hypothetical protein
MNATEDKAYSLIKSHLIEIGLATLNVVSEPITQEELYHYLIPAGDYQTLVDASLLMPPISHWVIDRLKLNTDFIDQTIEYSIIYQTPSTERVQWLWPEHLNAITAENELGRRMLPLVDIAIQWRTTLELFELFSVNRVPLALTVRMLPWLRLVVPQLYSNDPAVFKRLKQYMEAGEPQITPGVSVWFNKVCKYGTELISLYNIVKDKEHPKIPNTVIITPIIDKNLIEDGLSDHFHEFYNAYTYEKQRRKLKATITGQVLDIQWQNAGQVLDVQWRNGK